MKTLFWTGIVAFISFGISPVFAKDRRAALTAAPSHVSAPTPPTRAYEEDQTITVHRSAPESTYVASHPGHFGIGFSTAQNTVPGASSALTGIFDLNRLDAFQAFFTIPQTSPFNLGGALLYKRTISEGRGAGFHVGGGFGLANVNNGATAGPSFALSVNGVIGFHFELPGVSHVLVHLDGGPSYNLINTAPAATSNFQIAALSPALGASIAYFF